MFCRASRAEQAPRTSKLRSSWVTLTRNLIGSHQPKMPGSGSVITNNPTLDNQESVENESGAIEVAADESLPPEKQISKLKRFLEAVNQLALPDQTHTVQTLIFKLVGGELEPGEFFKELNGATKFPLRPYVIPFLYSSLPLLRKECESMDQNDLKNYIFQPTSTSTAKTKPTLHNLIGARKRKINLEKSSDVPEKRPFLNNMWRARAPELRWITTSTEESPVNKPKSFGSIRPSLTLSEANGTAGNNNYLDPWAWYTEEWRHIENLYTTVVTTMERLRYSMILFQQKSRISQVWTQQQQEQRRDSSIKMEEVQRKADVTVQEVKKAAVSELQKAVQVAERKAMESVNAERAKWERILRESQKQDDSTENCWNCGRKAGQTCSGCGMARYCGVFCQHKDWSRHRATCCSHQETCASPLTIKTEQPSPSGPKSV